MMLRLRFATSCLLAGCLALTSCGQDGSGQKPADAGVPDASKEPIVGGKLGAAIASAAAASSATAKAKAGDEGAPPETGIFAPGEADKRQPRDAAPKLELLGEGADPKVQLALKLDAPEQKTTVTIGMRMGQGMRLPTVEFALSIKPEKGKGEKPKDPAAPEPLRVAATVTGTSLPGSQNIPKELGDAIGKLKGTVVRWDLTAAGAAQNHAVTLPKDAGEGLELVVDALVDVLSGMTAPLPAKPVGKDAYWMVGDRSKTAVGLDVVRYRVFKVQSIEGDAVTMSVDIRQYAADGKLKIDTAPGQKSEMPMEAFDSAGKGTVVWKADGFLPVRGDVTEAVRAKISAGGRGSAMVQTELTGQLGGGVAPAAPAAPAQPPGKKP